MKLENIDVLDLVSNALSDLRNNHPIDHWSLKNVGNALVVRVAAAALAIITAPTLAGYAIADGLTIYTSMKKLPATSSLTILKAEMLYVWTIVVGYMQMGLTIICPELMMSGTFDSRQPIHQSVAAFWFSTITSSEALLKTAEISPELLGDGGARVQNFKQELWRRLLETNVVLQLSRVQEVCREVLRGYYSDDEIFFADDDPRMNGMVSEIRRVGIDAARARLAQAAERLSRYVPYFHLIEETYGKDFLKREREREREREIREEPLGNENAFQLLRSLIFFNKKELAVLILDRLLALQPAEQPAWFHVPLNRAQLFMSAAHSKDKALAATFALHMSINASFSSNNKTPFIAALDNGWKDLAAPMLEEGVDFSNILAYDAVKTHFGVDVAHQHVNFKAKNCDKLIMHLFETNAEELLQLLPRAYADASLLSKEFQKVVTRLYFVSLAMHQDRKNFLPYVDFTLPFKENSKKALWEVLEEKNQSEFEEDVAALDSTQYDQYLPLLIELIKKESRYAEPLFNRLMAAPVEEKRKWSSKPVYFSTVLAQAVQHNRQQMVDALLPDLDTILAGKSLFRTLGEHQLPCGCLTAHIRKLLAPCGIPENRIQPTTTVSELQAHVTTRRYLTSDSITNEQKKRCLHLLLDDVAKVEFWPLLLHQTNPHHMQKPLKESFGVIPPLPQEYNVEACLNEILRFVDDLWKAQERVFDDGSFRTKDEIFGFIRSRAAEDFDGGMALRALYGHIFLKIRERLRVRETLKRNELQALQQEVKQFVQALGVTMHHCTDRRVTDGRRYYAQFVENKKRTIEEDERTDLEEVVHEELLRLRRTIFREAYFSVDTNAHDAATEREAENRCNLEFGLHFPPLNSVRDYQSLALQDKIPTIKERFLSSYNPCRIAYTLHKVISEEMQKPRQTWYMKIQKFLENKHPNIDWNIVFNVESNTITEKGTEMVLLDLNIVT